jgi:3-hydroxyisobutyrate dehydrogenase
MSKPRVALIGLGLMGSGMARRLLGAGFPLSVYNRNSQRAAPLADEGAHVAASPREAAARADVVLSMVSDDVAARAVWLGEQWALAGAARGTVLVDCSTVTVAWIEELSRAALAAGCPLLDAPVTGSKPQAAAGELLPRRRLRGSARGARPALAVMSRAIVHVGPTGSGALLQAHQQLPLRRAGGVAGRGARAHRESGLDRAKALEVLTAGAPGAAHQDARGAGDARDFAKLRAALAAKGRELRRRRGRRHGVAAHDRGPVLELYGRAIANGHGEEDFSSVVEALRKALSPQIAKTILGVDPGA